MAFDFLFLFFLLYPFCLAAISFFLAFLKFQRVQFERIWENMNELIKQIPSIIVLFSLAKDAFNNKSDGHR